MISNKLVGGWLPGVFVVAHGSAVVLPTPYPGMVKIRFDESMVSIRPVDVSIKGRFVS